MSSPFLAFCSFFRDLLISVFLLIREVLAAALNAESLESLHLSAPKWLGDFENGINVSQQNSSKSYKNLGR